MYNYGCGIKSSVGKGETFRFRATTEMMGGTNFITLVLLISIVVEMDGFEQVIIVLFINLLFVIG